MKTKRVEVGSETAPARNARPRFRPHLAVCPAPAGEVYLVSGDDALVLGGPIYARLAPLLDGRRTVSGLIAAVADEVSAAEVYYALDLLERRGLLTLGEPGEREAEAAFWGLAGSEPQRALERVAETAVAVVTTDPAVETGARQALTAAGLTVAAEPDSPVALTLLVARDYLDSAVARHEEQLRSSGRPLLLVQPFGLSPWIGPLLIPGETACLECLAQRLRLHRDLHAVLRRRGIAHPIPPAAGLGSTVAVALHWAATEIARWAADGAAAAVGSLLCLDLERSGARRHRVVRRPQCPACGDPRAVVAAGWEPPTLRPRTRTFTVDGGHRICPPEETLARLAHHISPITGVVPSLEPLPGPADGVMHAYSGGRNLAMPARDFEEWTRNRRHPSGGKGMTDAQARAGAVAEAIERYCATFQGEEPRRTATLEELGEEAIHPHDFLLFSERQYAEREERNRRAEGDRRCLIPAPFAEREAVEWTPIWSLRDGRRRFLPTACCYLGYQASERAGGRGDLALGDTNGCAAGNSLEEAVLQALLELVERDAVALWWYNRVPLPGVDPATFEEPWIEAFQRRYRQQGRDLWLLNLTTDLEIPVFAAVSTGVGDGGGRNVCLGFGAHLETRIAAQRALTEVHQMVAFAAEGTVSPRPEVDPKHPPRAAIDLEQHPYLKPAVEAAARGQENLDAPWTHDCTEDVRHCVERMAAAGVEAFVVDQSRPDLELAVVKVIAPGLRHFWPRFGPGRLYQVPVRLGWLPRPRREDELNSQAPFF